MTWVVITSEPEDGEMTVNEPTIRARGPFDTRELATAYADKIETDWLEGDAPPAVGVTELEAP